MGDVNRRDFVLATVAAVCAGCLCDLAEGAPASGPAKGPLDVGAKAQFDKDGMIFDKFSKSDRVIIVRNEGKIYALNSTCTHKNASVKQKDGGIVCPNHGSRFSLQGTSIKGPAKGSLNRYAISVNDAGNIIVDRSRQFEEKKWDDPAAFITA